MSFYKHYFVERNPNIASYETTEEMVKKYKGDDYSLRFVKDFDDEYGDKVNKVGVNTQGGWNNPRGIYGYWVDDITDNIAADYGRNFSKAYILKRIPVGEQIIDIGSLGRADYKRLNEKLKEYINGYMDEHKIKNTKGGLISDEFEKFWNKFLKDAEYAADNKSDGGILFYSIILLSQVIANTIGRKPDTIQTEIWRKGLGVTFIGDKGAGIIHPNEKGQVLFLSPKAYKVVDSTDNKKKYDVLKGTNIRGAIRAAIFKDNVEFFKNIFKNYGESMDNFAPSIGDMYNRHMNGVLDPAEHLIDYFIKNVDSKVAKKQILRSAIHYGRFEDVEKIEDRIGKVRWGGSELMSAIDSGSQSMINYVIDKGVPIDDDVLDYAINKNTPQFLLNLLTKEKIKQDLKLHRNKKDI